MEERCTGGDFLKIPHPTQVLPMRKKRRLDRFPNIRHTRFLVKGSRSMQMEKTIQSLIQKP